jgi:hypothetical protein
MCCTDLLVRHEVQSECRKLGESLVICTQPRSWWSTIETGYAYRIRDKNLKEQMGIYENKHIK